MGAAGYGRMRFAVSVCGCAEPVRGLSEAWKGFGRKARRCWRVAKRWVGPRKRGRRVRGAAIVGEMWQREEIGGW